MRNIQTARVAVLLHSLDAQNLYGIRNTNNVNNPACILMRNRFGGIAQLEERALCKREAPGSKPGISKFYRSISLEVRTPRCGRGNPGSNPGSSINFFDCCVKIYSRKNYVCRIKIYAYILRTKLCTFKKFLSYRMNSAV